MGYFSFERLGIRRKIKRKLKIIVSELKENKERMVFGSYMKKVGFIKGEINSVNVVDRLDRIRIVS